MLVTATQLCGSKHSRAALRLALHPHCGQVCCVVRRTEKRREWLRKYLKGSDGAKDGGVSVYVLSRQDLQRWYHVEGLTGAALQERYREECGIYADRANLTRWVSAQTLPSLENNEDIHTHACGEYVLEKLQSGKTPEEVVEKNL